MIYRIKGFLRKLVPEDMILFVHRLRAIFANIKYGFPSRKMKIIAVAGTKGKTTTTNMITHILDASGYKVAMLSTANFQIGEKKWLNDVKLTTPSAAYVQKFLKQAALEKCEYAILEASSHGLVQSRYWGIKFDTVVVTNLTSDHLDYHKTFENYKNSHRALVGSGLKNLIVNYDDPNTHELLNTEGDFKKTVFTLKELEKLEGVSIFKANDIRAGESGSSFRVYSGKECCEVKLPLMGEFNIYNALGAIAACRAENISMDKIVERIEIIDNIPGRLEKIEEGQGFEVVVDYAHSPESLEHVYKTVKPYVKNRMIAVLGGTGDRDKTYRNKGGELADIFADVVIVTNEDPYSEKVEDIIDQVMSGIKNKKDEETLFRVSDRREAIKKALDMATEGDLVIITGKGCEQFMIFGDKKIPWDDREVVRNILTTKKKMRKE